MVRRARARPALGRLRGYRRAPIARAPWALDSGGFTELDTPPHRWTTTPAEYIEAVQRYATEIGRLEWAAPQDWMCEPWIVQKTGLSVREDSGHVLSHDESGFHLANDSSKLGPESSLRVSEASPEPRAGDAFTGEAADDPVDPLEVVRSDRSDVIVYWHPGPPLG